MALQGREAMPLSQSGHQWVVGSPRDTHVADMLLLALLLALLQAQLLGLHAPMSSTVISSTCINGKAAKAAAAAP